MYVVSDRAVSPWSKNRLFVQLRVKKMDRKSKNFTFKPPPPPHRLCIAWEESVSWLDHMITAWWSNREKESVEYDSSEK